MRPEALRRILEEVAGGGCTVEDALGRLRAWPFEDLGFAHVDHHRQLRCGFPEVVLAERKQPQETLAIAESLARSGCALLVTRAGETTLDLLATRFPDGIRKDRAGTFRLPADGAEEEGLVVVLAAGTSDLPVAEEAVESARATGARVELVVDVGVAGLHRLIPYLEMLRDANAIVAVAGMEGALPSVVAGLAGVPVVAVPTSVGYGASFGGLAALLGMLNSCASGVTVVNIDNGFGGGFAAGQINRRILAARGGQGTK